MNRIRTLIWCLVTVCLAAIVSYLIANQTVSRAMNHEVHTHSNEDFHDWLHENLGITAEQEKLLTPHEMAFEKDRAQIQKRIEAAGQELANAIRKSDADSTDVTQAREVLTSLQGELQQATLDHFFAMKKHLTKEQGEKLLSWTHDSIVYGHHD